MLIGDEQLSTQVGNFPPVQLRAQGRSRFFTAAGGGTTFTFEGDEAGASSAVIIVQNGQNVRAERDGPPSAVMQVDHEEAAK